MPAYGSNRKKRRLAAALLSVALVCSFSQLALLPDASGTKTADDAQTHGFPHLVEASSLEELENLLWGWRGIAGADDAGGDGTGSIREQPGFLRGPAAQLRLEERGVEGVACAGGIESANPKCRQLTNCGSVGEQAAALA